MIWILALSSVHDRPVSSHVGVMESTFLSVVVGTLGQASMLILNNGSIGLEKESMTGSQEKRVGIDDVLLSMAWNPVNSTSSSLRQGDMY